MKRVLHLLGLIVAIFMLFSCSKKEIKEPFVILSGSENESLEPLIKEFGKKEGVDIVFKYNGSLEIARELQKGANGYDAIWPASSIWIHLGDKNSIIKHAKSIMHSPVIFGVKKSVAQKLGFVNKDVMLKDIANAIKEKRLSFAMTSATQSNSGAMAYLGFLYALNGTNEPLLSEDLKKPELKKEIKAILSGINRSSGSSGWLKELFLNSDYDAMVNYESIIIETNKELIAKNKEPLYAIYPLDAIAISDSPLGYVNHGNKAKEKFFLKLQSYLLSDSVQEKILKSGRRVNSLKEIDSKVFDKTLGFDLNKIVSPIKLPSADVIYEALNLYQSDFKKPSFTVFALDVSGSMAGDRIENLKKAMKLLFDENSSKEYLLQGTNEDVVAIIPFNHKPLDMFTTYKSGPLNEHLRDLNRLIDSLVANGGTDIYTPALKGVKYLASIPNISDYIPAVILLTDGESRDGMSLKEFEKEYKELNVDIPVFSIKFGEASSAQLKAIADITKARVFDAKNDLIKAFRTAKGYN